MTDAVDTPEQAGAVDRARSIIGLICLFVMGPMFFLLMPIYVGALVDHMQLSESQAGLLASLELLGSCIASVIATTWVRRLDWRVVALSAAIVLIVGNILSVLFSTGIAPLMALRVLTGFASGCLVSLACAGLGDTRLPDRNFAYGVVAQLLVSGALFIILPSCVGALGVSAIYGLFALCGVIAFVGALLVPRCGAQHEPTAALKSTKHWRPLWGLAGGTAFFVANTAVWAYIERIGVASGLEGDFIGLVLGVGVFASVLGPLAAAWIGDRINRFWVMAVALAGELACLLFLKVGMSGLTFALIVLLYQVFWNLWVPYQMGLVAAVDTTGRFTVLIPLFQAAGIALGPALAAVYLESAGYIVVNAIGAGFAVLALLLFIPVTLKKASQFRTISMETC
jgi:predicted MFS family arabinose efflux permease